MSGRKIILGINDDATLHGGDGDDHFIAWGDFNKAKQTFVNDPKRDVKFYGNGGNDKLVGAGGNDFLDGGSGDDTILDTMVTTRLLQVLEKTLLMLEMEMMKL